MKAETAEPEFRVRELCDPSRFTDAVDPLRLDEVETYPEPGPARFWRA